MAIIGLIAIWIGVFFSIVGIVGLIRFPDVYTRLHASGKVGTLGLLGILIGVALILPGAQLKILALAIFIVVTFPVAAHAIAAAAHRQGIPMVGGQRDDLTQE